MTADLGCGLFARDRDFASMPRLCLKPDKIVSVAVAGNADSRSDVRRGWSHVG